MADVLACDVEEHIYHPVLREHFFVFVWDVQVVRLEASLECLLHTTMDYQRLPDVLIFNKIGLRNSLPVHKILAQLQTLGFDFCCDEMSVLTISYRIQDMITPTME